MSKVNWSSAWEEAVESNGYSSMNITFSLSSISTLEEGIKNIIQYLGLQAAERTDKVPEGKTFHSLLLAGKHFTF